jgi:hopanoid biosynthesis associated protein HpnK
MARRLIINADDFGWSPQVNEAVEKARTQGVLTSATLMTNVAYFKDAVAIAKRLPHLGVGVHLNLFKSKPVSDDSQVRCLLDSEGNFRYSHRMLALLSMFSHRIRKAIKIEMSAQIQRFIDSGLHPTHLDSHKHIHFFPAVYPIVCSLARLFKISAVRYCWEPAALSNVPWPLSTPQGKQRAKQLRKMAGFNRLYDYDLFKTEMTYGLTHLGRIDTNFFKAVSLYTTAQAAELMTHPATGDDSADSGKLLKFNRKTEFEALCDERTKKYLQEADIELIHYGQL